MLLRYFSFFVLRSYHFYHIRPLLSFGRRKKRNKKKREGGNNTTTGHPFFSFFLPQQHKRRTTRTQDATRDERRESPKKKQKKKKKKKARQPTPTKRREKGSDCRFRFHLHREASLPLEIRESSSLDHHHAILLSKARRALLGKRFAEKKRENLRVFLEGRRAILLLGNFKRL